eukprot:2410759-Rhodomonas_salina.2
MTCHSGLRHNGRGVLSEFLWRGVGAYVAWRRSLRDVPTRAPRACGQWWPTRPFPRSRYSPVLAL